MNALYSHRIHYAAIVVAILCMPLFAVAANKNMPPAAPPPDVPATRPNVLPPSESQMQLLPVETLPAEAISGTVTKDAETNDTEEAGQKSPSRMNGSLPYALLTVVALVLIGIGGFFYLRRNNLS